MKDDAVETAFHDIPRDKLPMTVEFRDRKGKVVHTIEVTGPGVMHVPPLAKKYGPVSVRMLMADGEVVDLPPPPGTDEMAAVRVVEENEEGVDLSMQSIVNLKLEPMVQLKWGREVGQLTPEEARQHARYVLECAEAAVHDAAMVRWLMERMELSKVSALQAMEALRKYRGDSTREDWRGE